MNIAIKNEFRDLILPLSPEEFSLLEQSILTHGIRDPLVIWRNGRDYLLDGHHRYQIIQKHRIKQYPTTLLKFDDKARLSEEEEERFQLFTLTRYG